MKIKRANKTNNEKGILTISPEVNGRMNYFASIYCEMAMESLYDAYELYELIEKENFAEYLTEESREMDKKIIGTIIFSAMTIESFLNNYAASYMGDDEFYDNFDKLSTFSKLQLIAKFVLKTNIDKGKAYYSYLNELVKNRNFFIHNKSKEFMFSTYLESECEKNTQEKSDSRFGDFSDMKDETKKDISKAINALKAVKEIAMFFDECTNTVNSILSLFHPLGIIYGNEKEKKYKEKLFPILKINIKK